LRTNNGDTFDWDILFSSIPLNTLCQITNDPYLNAAGKELSHSSVICFNIGLKGPLPPELEGIHWIYVPDRAIPFYRVGFYTNISKGASKPGTSSLYVEVGIASEELQNASHIRDLQPEVIASLEKLGWISNRDISCIVIHVIEHAYVHLTEKREHLIGEIFSRLKQFGVHTFGRYGLWDYMGMEDSIESAISTVREVLS
jgi:protoporphyrinogen oxidase